MKFVKSLYDLALGLTVGGLVLLPFAAKANDIDFGNNGPGSNQGTIINDGEGVKGGNYVPGSSLGVGVTQNPSATSTTNPILNADQKQETNQTTTIVTSGSTDAADAATIKIDSGVAATSPPGTPVPIGIATCDDISVPNGSTGNNGGINLFGVAGFNFGRTRVAVAHEFKGAAFALSVCAKSSVAKTLAKQDLSSFLLTIAQYDFDNEDEAKAAYLAMLAKSSSLGLKDFTSSLRSVYITAGAGSNGTLAVYDVLTGVNEFSIRLSSIQEENSRN